MFDKNLFFSLCEKYNIELSNSAEEPMIKDSTGIHSITSEDVNQVFAQYLAFFEYSSETLDANIITSPYYLQENFAIAC